MTLRALFLGAAALALHGCAHPPTPNPHYVLGRAYQAGGVWHYPRETSDLDETGIAAIAKDSPTGLTTDGELFSQSAMAGGHPTLQLPAIARLTNLENGRQVTIRINDRGAGNPHLLMDVTRRTAHLLAFPASGLARVRLELLAQQSQDAADALPGAPRLAVATAPRGAIEVAELPLPGNTSAAAVPVPVAAPAVAAKPAVPPMRLPETLTQTTPNPGQLIVRLDTFGEFQFAAVQQAKMAAAGAHIVYLTEGRTHQFRVDIGPLPSIAQADAVLDRALAYGIPDARIVVE